MRFIYIDSRGNEVEVASVEALAARIQLGAITPETRLYDEAADLWAPADAHPVYRQILREGVAPGQSMGRVPAGGEMPGDAPGPVSTRGDAEAAADATSRRPSDVPRADIPGLVAHTGTPDGNFTPPSEEARAADGPATSVEDLAPAVQATGIEDLAPSAPTRGVDDLSPESDGAAEPLDPSELAPDPAGTPTPADESAAAASREESEVAPSPPGPESAEAPPAPAPSDHEPDAFDLGLSAPDAASPTHDPRPSTPTPPARETEPPAWTGEPGAPPRDRRSFGDAGDSPPGWDPGPTTEDDVAGVAAAAREDADESYFEVTSLGESFERERDDHPRDPEPSPMLPAAGGRARRRGFWDFVDSRSGAATFLVMATLVMVAFGTSAQQGFVDRLLWVVGGVAAGAAVASLGLAWNRRNRFLIPPATLVLVAALSVFLTSDRRGEQVTTAALAELERAVADLEANRPDPGGDEAAQPVPSFPEIPEDLSGAGFQAMTDRMRAYRAELGLPDGPPRAWLEGIYLASASRFPGVSEYFEGARDYILDLREMEDSLYRAGIEAQVARDGLTGAEAERQVDDAMLAFRVRDSTRGLAYDQVEEVAAAALYLHDLLVLREDDIEYDPFTREGVSRDPVLEAVPTDSVLQNEMNARIDRLTFALDRLNALAAVRTERLQEILFARLWAAMLAAPPSPDSLAETH